MTDLVSTSKVPLSVKYGFLNGLKYDVIKNVSGRSERNVCNEWTQSRVKISS